MKIELLELPVRELVKDYADNDEAGVKGYGGKLDIRPPYQREFVYKDKQRDAVINTVIHGFPLNVMYWAVCGDDQFEILDGQQRTISICQYVDGDFSFDGRFFHNLQDDEKEKILNYTCMIYKCSGTASEKLDWFKVINISGVQLTNQELRNAVYSGPWVTNAKQYFSKRNCPADGKASDYLNGSLNRQDYLETAIDWISKGDIEEYMGRHQNDSNANALWQYFDSVITWVEATFIKKRKFMKGVQWGPLYDQYKDNIYDTQKIEEETSLLISDDDVENKKGIYSYILSRDEKYLNIRSFSDSMKQKVFEKQNHICNSCKQKFDISEMEGDHIKPWSEGGKTIEENCQMLCRDCNRRKSNKWWSNRT